MQCAIMETIVNPTGEVVAVVRRAVFGAFKVLAPEEDWPSFLVPEAGAEDMWKRLSAEQAAARRRALLHNNLCGPARPTQEVLETSRATIRLGIGGESV